MEKISNLLDRFKHISIPNEAIRNHISEIIYLETGENIDFKNISIRSGVAYIKSTPAVKSLIFIKKAKILGEINRKKIEGIELKDIK